MGVRTTVEVDAEVTSIGQRDQRESYSGTFVVEVLDDGRVKIGRPTQSGFESIAFDPKDVADACALLSTAEQCA